jgi:predicted ATPase
LIFLRKRLQHGESFPKALHTLRERLERRGLTAFDARNPQQREQAVTQTIGVSLNLLTSEEQARYAELAVFPEDVDVPLATVARLWDATGGLDDFASEELCVQLSSLSLLLRYDLAAKTIRLHAVVRLYLQAQHAERKIGHSLLSSCTGVCVPLITPPSLHCWPKPPNPESRPGCDHCMPA